MTTDKPLPLLKADVLSMLYDEIAQDDERRAFAAECVLKTFSNQDIRRYWLKKKTQDMELELLSEKE